MITKDMVKSEIDKMQDQYLEALYRIIKALEDIPASNPDNKPDEDDQKRKEKWLTFIDGTYGCLSDDPIERGDQGEFEIREEIE